MHRLERWKWIILGVLLAGTVLALGTLGAFAFAIRQNPGNTFTREGIMQILSKESTVYFSDGKSKVGTFFEGQHRDYVPYDSIPPAIIDASRCSTSSAWRADRPGRKPYEQISIWRAACAASGNSSCGLSPVVFVDSEDHGRCRRTVPRSMRRGTHRMLAGCARRSRARRKRAGR